MNFILPPRLQPGDKVAIVSPSAGFAAQYPWVYELGLKRIKEIFHLQPVEFPNTLKSPAYLEQNPQARADDINAAFADSSIKAIIANCGGNDEVRILPYLDTSLISTNPKIFMGYSDNTNLHLCLWNLGIISYYGGHVKGQFAMQGKSMQPFTIDSIKKALFEPAIGEITSSPEWTDFDFDWNDKANLTKTRPMYPSLPWLWFNCHNKKIQGRLWGGNLEILSLHFAIKRYLPDAKQLHDCILYLETSEEMPHDGEVYRFIAALAELNLLHQFQAILFGYPKTQFCGMFPPEGREQFLKNQKDAVIKALKDYHSTIPVIFNMNFGHTDPQLIIPNGGLINIDCQQKKISLC